MKTKIYLLFIIASLLVIQSCKKDDDTTSDAEKPTADFSYSGANTYAPAEVSFTNNSTNATSYHWDFGDNSTSTEKNPKHTYLNGGTYTVTLKATGDGGSETISKTVNITNKPTVCKLKKIYLIDFPFVDPNTSSGWDSNDGPDVYFLLLDTNNNNNSVLFGDASFRYQDVTQSMLPINWYWSSGNYWQIPVLDDFLFIDFYDYDPYSDDEHIGYVSYKMSNYMTVQNHYPSEITLTQNNITVKFEIQWEP